VLTHLAWTAVPGLRHGFLDRSEPDAPAGPPIALPRQVHGARIALATRGARPEADGLVTTAAGLGVGVVTADCVPVLLVDRRARAAAAVHAGWRGAAGGVLEAAVAELTARCGSRPDDLEAVAGPAIGGCCYEIGADVIAAFEGRTGSTTAPALTAANGRHHLDLRTAVRLLLAAAGVRAVAILGPCTACGGNYHSYRRDGGGTGRQLSFVGWA
jgi:purine-nucleoside/S-methyl-5'-thioadenosine phosphorylase / adenosine deaminase